MPATIHAIIDGPEQRHDDTDTCVRKYIVHGVLDATQRPKRNKPYTLGKDWPGTKYKVLDWSEKSILYNAATPSSSVWELTVLGTTKPTGGPGYGFGPGDGDLKRENPQREMGSQDFVIDEEYVGARKAEDEDTGLYPCETGGGPKEQYPVSTHAQPNGKDNSGAYLYPSKNDWIYKNGTAEEYKDSDGQWVTTTKDIGSPALSDAPFLFLTADVADSDGISSRNPLRLRHIGKKYECMRHTVVFWVKTDKKWVLNAPTIGGFRGRVIDWGPHGGTLYGPIVPDVATEVYGQWKCETQTIAQDFDRDGERVLRITRTFLRVPHEFTSATNAANKLIWSSTIEANTWPWDYAD